MFFTNGVLLSALLPRFPELKELYSLSNTQFGLLVVSFPAGAIAAAALAGLAVRRVGTIRTTVLGSVGLALAMAVAGSSDVVWLFAVALVVGGALDALVDAAQNVQGVVVEQWRGRSIMNSFHAVWSVGAATGGLIGAAAAAAEVDPGVQMVVNGVVWSVVAAVAGRLAVVPAPVSEDEPPLEVGSATSSAGGGGTPWRLLAPLVVLAICGTLVEDVANNWAVLFLREETDAPGVVAGLGLTTVLVAQFVGRLLGDPATDRWGRDRVASTGGVLVAAGSLAIALSPTYPVALLGLALAGFGCATLVPAAFAAAGRVPGLAEGTGIAVLGWLMRLGFLITSPAIGSLSDLTNLRVAMVIPLAAGVVAAVIAWRTSSSARAAR